MHHSDIKPEVRKLIANGTVIPAHPLALDSSRKLDIRHQRALSRYYIDAGAGGLAVGVHTTQFAIREAGMYRPVLELAAETASAWTKRPLPMVAGLVGPTQQAATDAFRREVWIFTERAPLLDRPTPARPPHARVQIVWHLQESIAFTPRTCQGSEPFTRAFAGRRPTMR